MAPFIAAALPALINAVPELARMFSSGSQASERNIKAAEVVVDIAKQAVGARNEQELIETMASDPEAVATVRQAVKDQWFRLEEVGGGIASARAANERAGERPLWSNPAILVSCALLPLVYAVVLIVLLGTDFTSEVKSMVIAAVISGALGGIVAYWLGTSASSARKTEILAPK